MDNFVFNPPVGGMELWQWWVVIATTLTLIFVSVAVFLIAYEEIGHRRKVCAQGHETYGHGRRCPTCGGKRWRDRRCRRCPNGHKVEAADIFCRRCGRKIAQ